MDNHTYRKHRDQRFLVKYANGEAIDGTVEADGDAKGEEGLIRNTLRCCHWIFWHAKIIVVCATIEIRGSLIGIIRLLAIDLVLGGLLFDCSVLFV